MPVGMAVDTVSLLTCPRPTHPLRRGREGGRGIFAVVGCLSSPNPRASDVVYVKEKATGLVDERWCCRVVWRTFQLSRCWEEGRGETSEF